MKDLQTVLDALTRYRTETPLGHQPYMITGLADEAIEIVRQMMQAEPVAWFELNESLEAWFLAYSQNPKAKTRPLYTHPAPQAVPTGFVLVPVEPTEAMRNAAIIEQEHHRKVSLSLYGDGPASEIYKAMIAAAPQAVPAETRTLYECRGCGHLHGEKVSSCDCLENGANEYNEWTAAPKGAA